MSRFSPSVAAQLEVERQISSIFSSQPSSSPLLSDVHANFLLRAIEFLPGGYSSLDASRPWLVYWILQSLKILGKQPIVAEQLGSRCLDLLEACWSPIGGFAGGPGQRPHLAPTYAAVSAIALLTGEEKLKSRALNILTNIRTQTYNFLISLKDTETGAFRVTADGEIDTRGAYTTMAVATILGIDTKELTKGLANWLVSCQTFEGGLGGEPGSEAHGGYSFCGLAALLMLGKSAALDLPALLKWSVRRQMRFEGGFQGRTNKLVDGCYSYWVGALFPLIEIALEAGQEENFLLPRQALFERSRLTAFILQCCQSPSGGLKDKPGKGPDLYHTCYCLAGLAIAESLPLPRHLDDFPPPPFSSRRISVDFNFLYNLPLEEFSTVLGFFQARPFSPS